MKALLPLLHVCKAIWCHRGRDHMIVGIITTYAISTFSCEFKSHSWRGVLDITLCDIICQWLATGQWFSPGTPVSSTNKTDHYDITEILLKVALNSINQPNQPYGRSVVFVYSLLITFTSGHFYSFKKIFSSEITSSNDILLSTKDVCEGL
jgi:hypothetical protein